MIIILCLDNNNGMMFNDRRQSQDRGLREYIAEMTKGEKVYMNAYTEKLYEEINDPVVCEDFLHKAGKGDLYCRESSIKTSDRSDRRDRDLPVE